MGRGCWPCRPIAQPRRWDERAMVRKRGYGACVGYFGAFLSSWMGFGVCMPMQQPRGWCMESTDREPSPHVGFPPPLHLKSTVTVQGGGP